MRQISCCAAIVVTLLLAGCSQGTQPGGTTGALAPDQAATQTAAPADTVAVAVLTPVDKRSCDELKVEMTGFEEAKIPQKLEQFGQSKYTPTAEELPRFQRFVQINQAMKTRCASMLQTAKPAETKKKKKKAKIEGAATPSATPEATATQSSG